MHRSARVPLLWSCRMNLTSSTCVRKASISFQRARMRSSSFGKSIDMAGLCAVLLVPVAGMFFWCLTPRNPPSMTQLSITEPHFHRLPSVSPPPIHHIRHRGQILDSTSFTQQIPFKPCSKPQRPMWRTGAKRECRNATDQRARNASGSLMNDTHLDNPMALLPRWGTHGRSNRKSTHHASRVRSSPPQRTAP
jgi:hypothetical protein